MNETAPALVALNDLSVYTLANLADCVSPSNAHGIDFILNIRTAFIEAQGYDYDEDSHSEIVNDAPSVYTHTMWAQFADLCAWNEDVSEYGDGDMNTLAMYALCAIADRLVYALEEFVNDFEPDEFDSENYNDEDA